MKKILCFIILLSACRAYSQQCRILRDADGQENMVIYFEKTKDYYPCGGPVSPRKKKAPNETLTDKTCDCNTNPGGQIDPIAPTASPAYNNIQFDFDSSVLRPSSYTALDAAVADLRENTDKTLELDGYASSEGTAAHNMKLAKDRANSVKTYLVNSGINPKRLKVKAYGETHPIADNSTEEGRTLNRRVEFKWR